MALTFDRARWRPSPTHASTGVRTYPAEATNQSEASQPCQGRKIASGGRLPSNCHSDCPAVQATLSSYG